MLDSLNMLKSDGKEYTIKTTWKYIVFWEKKNVCLYIIGYLFSKAWGMANLKTSSLVGFLKLLRDMTSLTASSWLKESLCKTGITSLFNGHSTWPASTIYDNVTGVSVFNIMKRGKWFKKFSKTLWKRCVIFLSYFVILFLNSPLNHFQSSTEQKKIWCGILHITFTCAQREDLVKRSPEKFTKNNKKNPPLVIEYGYDSEASVIKG